MITLTPEECGILIKKLEYNFKKKANLKISNNESLNEAETIVKKLLIEVVRGTSDS